MQLWRCQGGYTRGVYVSWHIPSHFQSARYKNYKTWAPILEALELKAQFGSMNYGNNLQLSMAQLTQNSSKSFTKAGDGCNAQVNMTCCEQLKEREEGWLIFGLRAVESGTEVMCPSIPLSVGTYWWDISLLFTVSLTRGPNPQAKSPLWPCPHLHLQVDGYLWNSLWQFKVLVQPEMKKICPYLHTRIWISFLQRILSKYCKSGPYNLCDLPLIKPYIDNRSFYYNIVTDCTQPQT